MRALLYLLCLLAPLTQAIDTSPSSGSSAVDPEPCKVSFTEVGGTESTGWYRGTCIGGVPHGRGTIEYFNGDRFSGEFADGVIEGNGKLFTVSGNVYEGNWKAGKRHGRGSFIWAQGGAYDGQWDENKRHGRGTYTWANGNRFEGEFRYNERYRGTYYTTTGRIYTCHLGQCQ